MQVLDDIRVLDLSTGPVGGLATTVLCDFGAEVVKVERPGGDPLRSLPSSPLWLRGKRSVELDLRDPAGRRALSELAGEADVVVTSFRPGTARRLGADHESLAQRRSDLVVCEITGWGPRGPLARTPGWEGLVAAKAGRMAVFTGQKPRAGPGFAALAVASHAAAQAAVHGICAALLARDRTGRGAHVATSLLKGAVLHDLFQLLSLQLARRSGGAMVTPVPVGGMPTLNYHPVPTADGRWIQLGNLLEHLFYSFLDAAELLPELLTDDRFQGSPAGWTQEATEAARDRILLRMRERTASEWMQAFAANGNVAAEPYATTQQALKHPDLATSIVEREDAQLGKLRQIGPIARLAATPGDAARRAPGIGEHRGFSSQRSRERSDGESRRAAPSERGRPLDGVTIVDFSTIIAGPLATSMLADLGARVVKVEPLTGDPYRALGEAGILAVKTNAGKQSLCVDLKSQEGRNLVSRLLGRADALVHNFRPGVPERLGIGAAEVAARWPGLVWVAASGYAPDGPSVRRPATHPVAGALAGGALFQAGAGTPGSDADSLASLRETARQLMRANEPNPDPNTSVVLASAILLGLRARARHGIGQAIHVDMMTANVWANADDAIHYEGKPDRPEVDAELLGLGATYRLYRAREGWVFLAAPTDRDFAALCAGAGWTDLRDDARFADTTARRRHDRELATRLAERFSRDDATSWEARLSAAGAGVVRVEESGVGAFLLDDEQSVANELAPESPHARFGALRRWPALVRCDGGPDRLGSGVLAGADTDAILTELGCSDEEIADLRARGIVGSEPVR